MRVHPELLITCQCFFPRLIYFLPSHEEACEGQKGREAPLARAAERMLHEKHESSANGMSWLGPGHSIDSSKTHHHEVEYSCHPSERQSLCVFLLPLLQERLPTTTATGRITGQGLGNA